MIIVVLELQIHMKNTTGGVIVELVLWCLP